MVTQTAALQSTTQKYLEIFDITNDVIMLQDGACSLVLKTSAINFDLFSEEEQDATIYAYAALLNSLSFPIEIVVRSQKKDVSAYLDLLKTQEVKAYNPVQKRQMREYRQFIEQLVQERNVLDKKFYIILTASAIELGLASATSVMPTVPLTKKAVPIIDKYAVLEKALPTLQPRRDHISHQCARIGLYTQQLTTQELIQLFYGIYNPEAAKGQKVSNTNDYTSPLVEAQLRVPPETTQTQDVGPKIQEPVAIAPQPAPTSPPPTPPAPPIHEPVVNIPPAPAAPAPVVSDLKPPTPPATTQIQDAGPKIQETTPTAPLAESPVIATPPTPAAPITVQTDSAKASTVKEETFILNTDLKPPVAPVVPTTPTT